MPNTGPSSARFYWEAAQEMRQGRAPSQIPLPAGVSMFPGEQLCLSRRWAEARFADLRYYGQAERGGHFAAMENPKTFVEHLRVVFQTMA